MHRYPQPRPRPYLLHMRGQVPQPGTGQTGKDQFLLLYLYLQLVPATTPQRLLVPARKLANQIN